MEPFMGAVVPMAFNFAPRGWYSCEGQVISIAQNNALFALLGTTYGGNGTSTFGLPDLRGRAIVGQGQGPGLSNYVMGQAAGKETATMTTATMPGHSHMVTIGANQLTSDSNDPQNNFLGGGTDPNYTGTTPDVQLNSGSMAAGIQGGGQPFSILNPFVAMYYNIAYEGIFPSRN